MFTRIRVQISTALQPACLRVHEFQCSLVAKWTGVPPYELGYRVMFILCCGCGIEYYNFVFCHFYGANLVAK